MRESSHDNQRTADSQANQLNRECYCITLDRAALNTQLQNLSVSPETGTPATQQFDHLFSNTPIFVPREDIATMERIVQSIESAAELPAYREHVLSWAPEIARFNPGPAGAFMGYDFHLGPDGPKLIEINTNAGGAFLNAVLARAQKECCTDSQMAGATSHALDGFEDGVVEMFTREWQTQNRPSMPNRMAIVDESPESQFLFPEFRLAQRLMEERGVDTLLLDPADLDYANGKLTGLGKPIDMVYNRLVDFALTEQRHSALKQAYLEGAVVLTPNPRAHALLADKRNLVVLSAPNTLRNWGLDEADVQLLERSVPKTQQVYRENADELWRTRRQWFFKPVSGHGSKGVYRGDKMTRRVFERILQEDYIAQSLVPPGERILRIDDVPASRKIDIRLYTYVGKTLLVAARIYQGQTTNFRTAGGGFAPVFEV